MKIRSTMGLAMVTVFVFCVGCSVSDTAAVLGAVSQGLSGINLSGGFSGGGISTGGGLGPFQPGTSGGLSPANPLGPSPSGSSLNPPNVSSVSGQQALAELAQRGIEVRGSVDEQILKDTLIAARQVRVENTQQLTIDFVGGGGGGMWYGGGYSGRIEIYSIRSPEITFHEICHHATLASGSTQGAAVGQNVMSWINSKVGGDWQSWPTQVVPTDYARTDEAEFQAEFFSIMRIQDLGLTSVWGNPADYADFNPPAELRQIANQFYDPAGAGGASTGSVAGGGTAGVVSGGA